MWGGGGMAGLLRNEKVQEELELVDDQIQDLEEMQILLYAAAVEMGVLNVSGPVTEGFYYPVSEEKCGRPSRAQLDCDNDEGRLLLLRGAASLVSLAVHAGDPGGRFPLLPREIRGEGETGLPCQWCEFRGVCRLEERALPPATDRKLDKLVNSKDRF